MVNRNGITIDRSSANKILVIGDIMLDQYIIGQAKRLCPEAPVPILEPEETSYYLGGAANVAANIRSMGGRVILAGVVGKDEEGERIRKILKQEDIPAVLGVDASRPTTVKQRVGTREQLVVRLDRELARDIPSGIFHDILRLVTVLMDDVSLVAVSDYGKGVVTAELMAAVCEICRPKGIPVLVSPTGRNFAKYKGADVIMSDSSTLEALYGKEIRNDDDLEKAVAAVFTNTDCSACIMTWESNGAVLFHSPREWIQYPCDTRRDSTYLSGAGDVFMAGLAMGISMGQPLGTVCRMANELVSATIGEVGTMVAEADDWNRIRIGFGSGDPINSG